MAALGVAEPEAKRPCTRAVTLHPSKDVGNLRERYTEDTADVCFVETKERLPAHRQVLSVASPVFYKLFNGDWKEKEGKEILAPEGYNWESFKAAIALLYGEEVEVKESSIPDIYGVAHLYDLREVIAVLAHEVCQWDSHLLETVVELCVRAQDMPVGDRSEGLLNAAVQQIARHLEAASPSDVVRLSYERIQMLVQSEDITGTECALVRILNHWTNEHTDITLQQVRQLYSHIRFGTIPFEKLVECSTIGHDNLKLALEDHQLLSLKHVTDNLLQITPRSGQKEIFPVYPLIQGLRAVAQPEGVIEVANICDSPAVGVVYYGKQEITFQVDLELKEASIHNRCHCELRSLLNPNDYCTGDLLSLQTTLAMKYPNEHGRQSGRRWDTGSDNEVIVTLNYLHWTVVLNPSGAHITLQSDLSKADGNPRASMTVDLHFTGPFPWLFAFGVRSQCIPSKGRIHLLTIHPPTL